MKSLNTIHFKTLLSISLAFLFCGCVNYTTPVAPRPQLSPGERNFEAIWQASRAVLREYHFEIDREDRREGRIETLPVTGQYFTEPWRKDAAGIDNLAESTVQTIYRRAIVTIRPVADTPDRFMAEVEVQTYRSNEQASQISSTTGAIRLFQAERVSDRRKMMLDRGRDWPVDAVTPLGRDEKLELKLAEDIQNEAAKQWDRL